MKIQIINGPNLNLLGTREPSIYGTTSFEDFMKELKSRFSDVDLNYFQSNLEGDLVTRIQECRGKVDGIVLNAGGYTHTSVAIHDAIPAAGVPVVEVHISNIYAREDFRHKSLITSKCLGMISGLGVEGYALAIQFLKNHVGK
jgi:3-dehydroquinate dehydratase-2